jgi:hypothetical protein
MSLPILYAQDPLSVPAKEYDKVWVELIEIQAQDPNGDAVGRVRLRRFGVVDGKAELEPDSYLLEVPNLIAESENDPELASAIETLMAYVAKLAVQKGIVAP